MLLILISVIIQTSQFALNMAITSTNLVSKFTIIDNLCHKFLNNHIWVILQLEKHFCTTVITFTPSMFIFMMKMKRKGEHSYQEHRLIQYFEDQRYCIFNLLGIYCFLEILEKSDVYSLFNTDGSQFEV